MALEPYLKKNLHKVDENTMDQVKHYAEVFMKREYPDEAPFFDIAWNNFIEALRDNKNDVWMLKGPTVRDARGPARPRDDIIMAPMVIRAFHLLFAMMAQRMEPEDKEILKQEMVQFLLKHKFSLEFSTEIVNFFMENRDSQ